MSTPWSQTYIQLARLEAKWTEYIRFYIFFHPQKFLKSSLEKAERAENFSFVFYFDWKSLAREKKGLMHLHLPKETKQYLLFLVSLFCISDFCWIFAFHSLDD